MSKNFMSHAQFASVPFGASRRLVDSTEGPSTGYYVSRDPDTAIHAGGSKERVIPSATPEAVGAHFHEMKARGAMEAQPDVARNNVYQGIWNDSGSDNTYLDVSDHYPESTHGLMHALQHGMANAQKAVWAAHNNDEQTVTGTDSSGRKLGIPEGVRQNANALHAQAARQSAAQSGKKFKQGI